MSANWEHAIWSKRHDFTEFKERTVCWFVKWQVKKKKNPQPLDFRRASVLLLCHRSFRHFTTPPKKEKDQIWPLLNCKVSLNWIELNMGRLPQSRHLKSVSILHNSFLVVEGQGFFFDSLNLGFVNMGKVLLNAKIISYQPTSSQPFYEL